MNCVNKKIIVTEKATGKQRIYSSYSKAAEELGMDRRIIAKSCEDPFHWTHRYARQLADGSYSLKRKICPYDFELVMPESILELWCDSEPDIPCKECYSITQAARFLGVSKNVFYPIRKTAEIGIPCKEPIKDKQGRYWMVIFKQLKSDFKSNIKRLQN